MQIKHEPGLTWVSRDADEQFRKLLIHGAPEPVASKLRSILAEGPRPSGYTESVRYYGDRLPQVKAEVGELMEKLERYFHAEGAPGFFEWLTATGFGNDMRMIEAMREWASMKRQQ